MKGDNALNNEKSKQTLIDVLENILDQINSVDVNEDTIKYSVDIQNKTSNFNKDDEDGWIVRTMEGKEISIDIKVKPKEDIL